MRLDCGQRDKTTFGESLQHSHRHNHPYIGIDCERASDGDKTFMRRTTEIMHQVNKSVSPHYGLSIIVNGIIQDLQYDENKGFLK